uniref:NADH-ubiquinone oxidoreductase chain 4L n=1 Tax=Pleroneura sp. 1 GYN-2021b TaxID=2899767 RepID=A0A9E9BPE2_9HYME|nr:NADH dehydrogenase subunit 4L [Pleroneura sp. 1 GYN-2021b]
MLMLFMYTPMLLFMFGLIVFISKRKHLLMVLLSIEFIMLSLFFFLFMYLMIFSYEMFFTMIFLTFSVCEGALGLSVLISLVRSHGNDYFQSFSIL